MRMKPDSSSGSGGGNITLVQSSTYPTWAIFPSNKPLMRYPLLFLPFVILASIPTTTAQSGILDETFGMNGVVLPQPGPGATLFGNVELQPDGKIITAGSITETESGRTDIFVQRLLPDGTLDATFGGAGTGMISLGSEEWDERGAAVTLRPDGTILIAANATDPIGGERDVQVI